jgi:PleD family two-component response regulator
VKSTVTHPILTKPAFQGVGSVLGGAVQCGDEVNMAENRILLVDPSENVLNVYKTILGEKYSIESASNLGEAYDLLKIRRYSVMITEYFEEDLTTKRMLEQVKKLAHETYVIIITDSLIDDTTYQKLFEDGVSDFILKPCSPQKILAHVRKGVRHREIVLRKEEIEAQSLVDPVIPRIAGLIERSVFNSVFFKERFRQELKRAKRHHHPLSLLLIPIPSREETGDQFESFYKDLANILSQHVREEDVVGRENGHFGILLPDTDQAGSEALMERLLNLIRSHPPFRSNELLRGIIQTLPFRSFTYPERFSIPGPLKAVIDD